MQNQRVRKSTSHRAYRNAMTAEPWVEPTSRRTTEDIGDGRPGWQLAKVAGGAVAAAFVCGFVVRRDWLPAKIITSAVGAIGAVLAVGTRSSTLRAVGSGAMAWATGQLGLCLVDDVMRGRLRAQVARALQPMESSVDGLPPDALVRAFARARAKLVMLGLCHSQGQARASPAASPDRSRAASSQADADTSTDGNVHGSTTAHVPTAPPSQGELDSSLVRPADSPTVITVDVNAPATADRAAGSPTWIEFASESSSHAWPTGMERARAASRAAWPAGVDSTVDCLAPQTSPTATRSPPTVQSDPAGTGVGSPGTSLDRTIHTLGSDPVPP
jgi:hypothetical protein